MSWPELIKREIQFTYKSAEGLMGLVDEDNIDWKPSDSNNWMTTGQVLRHLTIACGTGFKGFVTGEWGMPDGMDVSEMSMEDMLPPAEKMPSIESAAEAIKLLKEDMKLALDILGQCSVEDLNNKPAPAPWDPSPMILGHRLLSMVDHLKSHKAQLYYYLKLLGKPVNTGTLWGMG
mgnify:CR=1 FL=1